MMAQYRILFLYCAAKQNVLRGGVESASISAKQVREFPGAKNNLDPYFFSKTPYSRSVGRKQWSNRLPHENIDQGKEFQYRNSLHLFMATKDGKLDKEQRCEGTGSGKNGKPNLTKTREHDSAYHHVMKGPTKKKK